MIKSPILLGVILVASLILVGCDGEVVPTIPTVTVTAPTTPVTPPTVDPITRGRQIFLEVPNSVGAQPLWCLQCHRIENIAEGLIGPDLTQIGADAANRKQGLSAEEYIKESITNPEAFIAEGVDQAIPGLMLKSITEGLTDDQVDDLVAFLLTQK